MCLLRDKDPERPTTLVLVYDSQYTRDMCDVGDGAPPSRKNTTVVTLCRRLLQEAVDRGVKVIWVKVRGHSEEEGTTGPIAQRQRDRTAGKTASFAWTATPRTILAIGRRPQTNREPHHGPYAGNGHCRASVLASERLDAKSWRSRANYLCSPSSSSPPFTHAQLGFWGLLSASEWDKVERQGSTRLSNAVINLLLFKILHRRRRRPLKLD